MEVSLLGWALPSCTFLPRGALGLPHMHVLSMETSSAEGGCGPGRRRALLVQKLPLTALGRGFRAVRLDKVSPAVWWELSSFIVRLLCPSPP